MSIFKVVGFLDDIYGSTIMTPDDWVTQTGADFDADSIYGICFEMYKDNEGVLHKIESDPNDDIKSVERRYCNYINSCLEYAVVRREITDEFIEDATKDLYEKLRSENEKVKQKDSAYSKLYLQYRLISKQLSPKDMDLLNTIITSNKNPYDKYAKIVTTFTELSNNANEDTKKIYDELIKYATELRDIQMLINNKVNENYSAFRESKHKVLSKLFEEARKEYVEEVKAAAERANLPSFEEFSKWSNIEQQSRRARNNEILQSMINIMKSTSSREENYSRSNFDDLTNALNRAKELLGISKVKRSAYNPLDQIDFFENAISGRKLKAFSVTRDTFNSICNHSKAELGKGHYITITYDLSTGKYSVDNLKKAFGETNVQVNEEANTVTVTHTRIGNSLNNRNVVGKLLTPYSSQTTAHILDAIKEGAIPNENEYTFGTFKTLIDVGVDYDTAIAFLMQPAITRIVNANNESNSIYMNGSVNAEDVAIKRIAKDFGILVNGKEINDYTSINAVWYALNQNLELKTALNELFGDTFDASKQLKEQVFNINAKVLENRLKSENKTNISTNATYQDIAKDVAVDIATILTFNKLHETTKNIEAIARLVKPDSFGAKQTIHSTRKIKDHVIKYITDDFKTVANTIKSGNTDLLSAIYPGIENGNIDVERSVYPYLAAFFKYSTDYSVRVNSQLFITEGEHFTAITDTIESVLGRNLNDEQHQELIKYIIQNVYRSVPLLTTPITVDKNGYIIYDAERIKSIIEREKINVNPETLNNFYDLVDTFNNNYWEYEKYRIFGYDVVESVNLDIEDINNPTDLEINAFNNLTPAQKVIWLQQNFKDKAGIFNVLNVNTFHQNEYKTKGYSGQSIKFNDQIYNIDDLLIQFDDAFFNKNPLVRLGAIDLIKYAFVVEGFAFKKGSISKIISNKSIYSDINDQGMALVQTIQQAMNNSYNLLDAANFDFIDKFIRSHSEYVKQITIPKKDNISKKFGSCMAAEGIIYIPYINEKLDLLERLTLSYDDTKGYIRINRYITRETGSEKVNVLYKLINTKQGVFLYPLNLLERNETDEVSVNKANNRFKQGKYYENIISYCLQNEIPIKEVKKDANNVTLIEEWKGTYTIKPRKFIKVANSVNDSNTLIRLQNNGTQIQKGVVTKFINDINKVLDENKLPEVVKPLVFNPHNVLKSLFPKGATIVQYLPTGEELRPVSITAVKPSKHLIKHINAILNEQIPDRKVFNKIPENEKLLIQQLIDTKTTNPALYRIEPVLETEAKEEYTAEVNAAQEESDIFFATTNAINVPKKEDLSDIDKVSLNIYNDINRKAKVGEQTALDYKKAISVAGVNVNSGKSLESNRKNLYESAADYYTRRSIEIINNIEHFTCLNGDEYAIDDPALYEHLKENPEDYIRLVRVILDAKTFGNTLADIFNLKLETEDPLTKKYINSIKNAINKVKDNNRITGRTGALNRLFNDYLANEYSSNPAVRRGLVELTSQFGDINWWDFYFADAADVDHKQIQTIINLVYTIIDTANTVIAPRAVSEFNKKVAEIEKMAGTIDYDKILPNGDFVKMYSEDFIKVKEEVFQKVRDAKEKFGEFSKEHFEAKLERDKWLLKYTHQPYVDSYYEEKIKLEESTYKIAGADFLEYLKLKSELYKLNKDFALMSKEERDEYDKILGKIRELQSDIIGSEFNPELKSIEQQQKAHAIKRFDGAMKNLRSEYFDTIEKASFRDTLTYFVKLMKNYEMKNPNETLDMRLQDDDYRRAYDWIQHNSTYKLNEEAQKELDEAYKALYPTTRGKNNSVKDIIKNANAYDRYGRINPRLLSNEDLERIKNLVVYDQTRHGGSTEERVQLAKDVPRDIPVYEEKFYQKIRNEQGYDTETNKQILNITKRINELISKGFDTDGTLNTIKLFRELSKAELKELGECYSKLRKIRKNRKPNPNHRSIIKNMIEKGELIFKDNTKSYNANLAQTKHLSEEEKALWYNIFTEPKGANLVPNSDIFGYITAASKYINTTLTQQRNLIENNVTSKLTEYYYEAEKEARTLTEEESNGLTEEQIAKKIEEKYNKWYDLNHVFNPRTRKMEPLFIWTTTEINPNGSLKGSYSYEPTYENTNRKIKDKYSNKQYRYGLDNYKIIDDNGKDTNPYKNTNVALLNDKEIAMLNLFKETMREYVLENKEANYAMKRFVQQGHAPRRASYEPDAKFYIGQALGAVGLQTGHTGDAAWQEYLDYTDDVDIPFNMLQTIKTKGYKEKEELAPRGTNETDEQYKSRVADNKKKNREIEKHNAELEQKVLDKDWVGVFNDFIAQAISYNAKHQAKDSIYLLMEDLKSRPAYKLNRYSGKVVRRKRTSTEEYTDYDTIPQNDAVEMTQNWMRKLIYNQHKKNHPWVKYADLMQNITSAKYMIFNVPGGIANIGTGTANIMGEVFARDYFDIKSWSSAQGEYFGNILSILADMYKPTSTNETAAILKMFNVVNFDSITERKNNESITDYTRRVQDALYAFQSGGEHYMQNTALLAMLNYHRVVKNPNTGKTEVKTFARYSWDIEIKVLETLLSDRPELLKAYNDFVESQKADLDQIRKYDNFTEDFNENFLRSLNDKEFVKLYITERNKALTTAKEEFKNYPTVRSQLKLNGDIIEYDKSSGLTDEHIGHLRSKVIKVNDKIHGVYHKIGAAAIEAEWWGGLVMQYHKHIYPGIMKRWRVKGYYNEIRESVERGSYMSLYKLASTEFKRASKKLKDSDDTTAVESIQTIIKAAIDTVININLNYNLMPVWEQQNLKRALGDLLGVTSAFLLATGVHVVTDEDELEENNFYATLIYIADRLNAESQMYTPWGLWSEASTLWSSPIAAQNGPKDLIKGLSIGIQALYDEDFNINYTTGLYKGQNKLAVLLYRNTPAYRVYQRLSTMNKNNSYYRINETALNIKFAKTIADTINPD